MARGNEYPLVIAVVGLQLPSGAPKFEATLQATGRKLVVASGFELRKDGIIFLFPREDELWDPVTFRFPLGLQIGNTIEFRTRIGGQVLKQRFSLRRMMYEGSPEL